MYMCMYMWRLAQQAARTSEMDSSPNKKTKNMCAICEYTVFIRPYIDGVWYCDTHHPEKSSQPIERTNKACESIAKGTSEACKVSAAKQIEDLRKVISAKNQEITFLKEVIKQLKSNS